MRVGFAALYSWRPHVEHLVWLAQLARQDGHQAVFLTCDANLPSCYTRELRPGVSGFVNCLTCRVGGVRSYEGRDVAAIGPLAAENGASAHGGAREWALSAAATIGRFESDEDFAGEAFQGLAERLAAACAVTYAGARRWIERERLDAVCAFNGRIDITRALYEAARDAGIRFISLERTWFGDGLQMLPDENCLGLRSVDRLIGEWRTRPLLAEQAVLAAQAVASRFLRQNVKEWRAYNVNASSQAWPAAGSGRRVLLLPGSRNEVYGHPDWTSDWPDSLAAYDALIDRLGLAPHEMVLRCHPNWAEKIGAFDGRRSEEFFTAWAERRGVTVVAAAATASTLHLIDQADAVVVGGSSAGLEAGILGRQVIAISPSIYQQAGFQTSAYRQGDLASVVLDADLSEEARRISAADRSRQALRFAYSMIYRVPQFVHSVRCVTTTTYRYGDADRARFTRLLRTGVLEPDDDRCAQDEADENRVLDFVARRDWSGLMERAVSAPIADRVVARRPLFRSIDAIRQRLPRGDLWGA